MIYRTVFIWPAINRGLPRRPREGICRKKLYEREPPSPGWRVCIVCVCVCVRTVFTHRYLFFRSYMHSYFQCAYRLLLWILCSLCIHTNPLPGIVVCLITTSPRLFNVFSAITFRDEPAAHTYIYILYIILYAHNTGHVYTYIGTASRFTTVLIPTSIPHREYIPTAVVYVMYI